MDYDSGVLHTLTFLLVEDVPKFCIALSDALAPSVLFDSPCVSGQQELPSTQGFMLKATTFGTGKVT